MITQAFLNTAKNDCEVWFEVIIVDWHSLTLHLKVGNDCETFGLKYLMLTPAFFNTSLKVGNDCEAHGLK